MTFEGMRQKPGSGVFTHRASGGEWSKSRKKEWVRIQDVYANRQHAALFLSILSVWQFGAQCRGGSRCPGSGWASDVRR